MSCALRKRVRRGTYGNATSRRIVVRYHPYIRGKDHLLEEATIEGIMASHIGERP
jgi:hypothetical protein